MNSLLSQMSSVDGASQHLPQLHSLKGRHVFISKYLKPTQSTLLLYLCSTKQDSHHGSSAKCFKFATHHVSLWRQIALDLTDFLV